MGQVDRLNSVPNKSRKSQGSGDWNPQPCDILYLSKAIESDEGGDTVELKMIAFGCDHGGVDLKDTLVGYLRSKGGDVRDFGTHGREAVDYPDFGKEVSIAFLRARSGRQNQRDRKSWHQVATHGQIKK